MENLGKDTEKLLEKAKEQESSIDQMPFEKQKEVIGNVLEKEVGQYKEEGTSQGDKQHEKTNESPYTYEKVDAYNSLSEENKRLVEQLIGNVYNIGVVKTVVEAKKKLKDPTALDAIHDILVDIILKNGTK